MVWTSDVTIDVLDLLSFFLAAPDLIGKSRLDEFERNIGGVLTRSLLAGPWARAKIRILRQWAWRIFALIIITYAVLGSILQWAFPDFFEHLWSTASRSGYWSMSSPPCASSFMAALSSPAFSVFCSIP